MIRATSRHHPDTELLRLLYDQFHAKFTDHLAQTVVPVDQRYRLEIVPSNFAVKSHLGFLNETARDFEIRTRSKRRFTRRRFNGFRHSQRPK